MSAWAWGLVGVAAFVGVGLLVALALGLGGMPADGARRLGQRIGMRRHVYRGTQLPDEVPEAVEEDEPGPGDASGTR